MEKLLAILAVLSITYIVIDAIGFQGTGPSITDVKFGNKLKCYQCDSFSQPKCSDFFDNKTVEITFCPDDGLNYTRCRKIIQEMYYDGTWERRYHRDCAVRGEIGAEDGRWCTDRLGTYRVRVRYCHCNNKEGCNSAPRLFSITSALLAFLLPLGVTWLTSSGGSHHLFGPDSGNILK